MKKLILLLPLLLIGCDTGVPRKSAKQVVVDAYKTDKVQAMSGLRASCSSTDFIVMDTNNTVWFVDVRMNGYTNYIYSSTIVFEGVVRPALEDK
jgi:hypothetical protein